MIHQIIKIFINQQTNLTVSDVELDDHSIGNLLYKNLTKIHLLGSVILSIVYFMLTLLCLIGNILIIWTVLRNNKMRNVPNYFVSNLAFADIIVGIFYAPYEVKLRIFQTFFFLNN
jgi:hypothetical protein